MEADQWSSSFDTLSTELAGRLLSERTLLLNGPISQDAAGRISEQLMVLAADSDEAVLIHLNAPGGDFEAALALYDMLRSVRPRVKLVAHGQVAGAGLLVFVAAEVQDRYSLPNARFELRRPEAETGLATDLPQQAEHLSDLRTRTARLIARAAGQPLDRVRRDLRHNKRLTTEEAVRYGLVGRLVERTDEAT